MASLMTPECWNAVLGLVHISAPSVQKLVFPASAGDKADCSDDAIDTAQAALSANKGCTLGSLLGPFQMLWEG